MRRTRRLSIRSPCFVLLPALPARFFQEGQITFISASGPREEECEFRLTPVPVLSFLGEHPTEARREVAARARRDLR